MDKIVTGNTIGNTIENTIIETDMKLMKKIDFIIKSMSCVSTQQDLQYLYEQLKLIQNPSIKWIIK